MTVLPFVHGRPGPLATAVGVFGLCVAWEIGQKFHWIRVYDPLDIVAYRVGVGVEFLSTRIRLHANLRLSAFDSRLRLAAAQKIFIQERLLVALIRVLPQRAAGLRRHRERRVLSCNTRNYTLYSPPWEETAG